MRKLFIKTFEAEAQKKLCDLFHRVRSPRWRVRRWKTIQGRRRVEDELCVPVELLKGAELIDDETNTVIRELADAFDLWYRGPLAVDSFYPSDWTELCFVKKKLNTVYRTHAEGLANTPCFDGVWDHFPSRVELQLAEGFFSYYKSGLAEPGDVEISERSDGLYSVTFRLLTNA